MKFIPNFNTDHMRNYSLPQFYFGILFTWRQLRQIGSLPDVEQWETHLLKLSQGNEKLVQLIIRLSIFVVTLVHPQGFA